jgi:importin subunit beta-1
LETIKKDKEEVGQQAVEFWSTLCDEEMLIMDEASEAAEYNVPPPRECKYFIKGAVKFLVPVLTEAMTKQVRSLLRWQNFILLQPCKFYQFYYVQFPST